jgi:competence protein ComEC
MLDFGRVKIAVLNPKNPPVDDINEDSIVLHVSYGKFSVLLAADAREVTEKHILATGRDIKSDILKVGHHGDRSASTEEFLRKVSPEIAVISIGQNNKYEKPHDEALSRLNASGAEVLRTDIHGNVIVETDGIAYSVYTEKK